MTYRKKLIEVALPLEAINRESAREKSNPFLRGHPRSLHTWWSRKPLSTCRAVLFASIVDDPATRPEQFPTEEAQSAERGRLFRIIEELVKWENSNNDRVLEAAREEIRKATNGNPPAVLDPFCGGGSISLEAQRLGLETHASDLNPVAVLITKALIEIPSMFASKPPVNPESRARMGHSGSWRGAGGLAEDARYYGRWVRDEAERRLGHYYPKVRLPKLQGGGEVPVIAWVYCRTMKCPNPACGAQMPLVSKFWLSTKPKKRVWIDPIVDRASQGVRFEIRSGEGNPPAGTVNRRGALCLVCEAPVSLDHIRAEGRAGRMDAQLMALVAEGQRERHYVPPNEEQEAAYRSPEPTGAPDTDLPEKALGFRVQLYGMTKHRDLFTSRQLTALVTLSDLVTEVLRVAERAALAAGFAVDSKPLSSGGLGAQAYAEAIATYVALGVDKFVDYGNSICAWNPANENVGHLFAKQAVQMSWDFVESSPLEGGLAFDRIVSGLADVLERLMPAAPGTARQLDATAALNGGFQPLLCTDPPYYDNIGYADLADLVYVWLRRSLSSLYPDLFSTLLTPKDQELVATAHRFGGNRDAAERFFEGGLHRAFERMREAQNPEFPLTLFYAFKQAEEDESPGGDAPLVASTGWETMLRGLLEARFAVTGTWPMRSERTARSVAIGTNALASSIVLVCRPKPMDARLATRKEFTSALKSELPNAVKSLQDGNIAPVDLAQAAIGPGMGIFSRYAKVLEADGSPMRVRTALGLINQALDQVLTEQESEYDAPTRWAIAWFDQHGLGEGKYGDAETLSKAKNVAVSGLVEEGFLSSRAGRVRLLSRQELDPEWDPTTDGRLSIWEVAQHLVRELELEGEAGAASLLRKLGALGEAARDLAYRLYTTCERRKWAAEALAYNSLVVAWPEISRIASAPPLETQPTLGV